MSYLDAIEDGVLITHDKQNNTWYHPACHICGMPVSSWSYQRNVVYTCKDCRAELVRQSRESSMDKKNKRYETAVKRISKVTDIRKYEEAGRLVKAKMDKPRWFQSTEEIMVAMELIRCGVTVHHQVRIYDYYVDFVLPDMRVILEIDGRPFHGKEKVQKQELRDDMIADQLGKGWEVIHIDTENINTNITRLLPAIRTVLQHRKRKEDSKVQ